MEAVRFRWMMGSSQVTGGQLCNLSRSYSQFISHTAKRSKQFCWFNYFLLHLNPSNHFLWPPHVFCQSATLFSTCRLSLCLPTNNPLAVRMTSVSSQQRWASPSPLGPMLLRTWGWVLVAWHRPQYWLRRRQTDWLEGKKESKERKIKIEKGGRKEGMEENGNKYTGKESRNYQKKWWFKKKERKVAGIMGGRKNMKGCKHIGWMKESH